MRLLTCRKIGIGTREEWYTDRDIALILAICLPIITTIMIWSGIMLDILMLNSNTPYYNSNTPYYKFSYPYDNLQKQECDSTNLVNIWIGKESITEQIKYDWKKLNGYFKGIEFSQIQ
jgi:hypothetical protein